MEGFDPSVQSVNSLLSALLQPEELALVDRPGVLRELARPGFLGAAARAGLSPASRARLDAAFELGRRRECEEVALRSALGGPLEVAALVRPLLRDQPVEAFLVVLLDGRHRLLDLTMVSRGTLTASLVHPREVFRPAIQAQAAAIIVAHNHPSGDTLPSKEDDAVTRRLIDSGEVLGIPLLDHLVIGEGLPYSYKASGHPVFRKKGAACRSPLS